MPKHRKPRKTVVKKLNALQRAKRALKLVREELDSTRHLVNVRTSTVEQRDTVIKDARQALANATEISAQKDGAIKLREARIVELTAERDRIIRIIDQFLSVQILTHGTEVRIGNAASAPSVLRPGLAPNVVGGTTNVYPVKSDALITAAQVVEKEHAARQASYRRPMYSV